MTDVGHLGPDHDPEDCLACISRFRSRPEVQVASAIAGDTYKRPGSVHIEQAERAIAALRRRAVEMSGVNDWTDGYRQALRDIFGDDR